MLYLKKSWIATIGIRRQRVGTRALAVRGNKDPDWFPSPSRLLAYLKLFGSSKR